MPPDPMLTMGEVSRRSGLAASAIRYYDAQGLVTSARSPGGHRVFPRSVLRRLAFVQAAQNVGLSLAEIAEAMARLPEDRAPTTADWERISHAWRRRLDEQIEALEALRDRLTGCIGCGCLSLRRCALSNPGDAAGAEAVGAAFLPARLRRPPAVRDADRPGRT